MQDYPDTNIIQESAGLISDIIPTYLNDNEYHIACELGTPIFKTGKLVYESLDMTEGERHQIYQFDNCYVYLSSVYGSCPGCFHEHNVLLNRVRKSYVSGRYSTVYAYAYMKSHTNLGTAGYDTT